MQTHGIPHLVVFSSSECNSQGPRTESGLRWVAGLGTGDMTCWPPRMCWQAVGSEAAVGIGAVWDVQGWPNPLSTLAQLLEGLHVLPGTVVTI